MSGWIKLHRGIRSHWLWNDADKLKAWIDLIISAAHKPTKVLFHDELIFLERGEHISSSRILAKRWKWSRQRVDQFLELLETDEMITKKPGHRHTLVCIINYNSYQSNDASDQASEKPVMSHSTDSDEPHNKNDKNLKNDKNTPLPPKGALELPDWVKSNQPCLTAVLEWLQYRKEKRQRIGQITLNKMLKKFPNSQDLIATIDQSIQNGWLGLFEVNAKKSGSKAAPMPQPRNPPPILKSRERTPEEKALHHKLLVEKFPNIHAKDSLKD